MWLLCGHPHFVDHVCNIGDRCYGMALGDMDMLYTEYSIVDVTTVYRGMLEHKHDFSKITREDVIHSLEVIP